MIELHLSQQDIYFDHILDSSNPQYNIGTYVVINGNLNVELLKESIISSEEVFDVFRFKSFSTNGPTVSLQEPSSSIKITELDFTDKNWSDGLMRQWLQERVNTPFDIHTRCLYDFVLIKKKKDGYLFYIGCHHLFSDGYGVPYVFLSYVFDKYHSLRTNEEKKFLYPSYLQLFKKSNDYLASDRYELDKNYWKDKFKNSQEPIFQKRIKSVSFRTNSTQLFFNLSEQEKLKSFCLKNEISLQDLLIATLVVYYKKTHHLNFFDFCLPIHNRSDRKERQTLGVFSKLIPCRIELSNTSLNELFKLIKANQRKDYRHKQFPVSHFNNMIQADVNNASRPFDVCVNYRYFRLETTETELSLKGFRNDAKFSKIPIEYSWCDFAEKGNENLFLEITFREDCFTKEEIDLLGQRILFILDQFYNAVDNDINTINIVPNSETKQLLQVFNDTTVSYPKDKTIVELFEEQVAKTPNHIAVVFEQNELTYKELNEHSNQLAHYLQKNYDIKPDDLVGIKQERSEWMIVSILGVLKSGGAYVPIDLNYPQERINYIEKDTKCKVCIDENELSKFKESQTTYSKDKITFLAKPHNLSHVIYTSGSTGKPKGVMIEHKNTYSFIKWSHYEFEASQFDTVLFTTSLNFDLSVFEIFYSLTQGKVLKIVKDGLSIPKNLDKDKRILINTVPSVVGALLQQGMSFESVSVLNMAGEPIPSNYKKELKGKVKEIRNLYGPSEDTTYSTFIRIDKDQRDLIGKPISNTQVYILSEEAELRPIGVIGEICIGGSGLARGYLNQEELTREKFLENPFVAGERLYKTGDLGRWLADGNIEFIGRKDDQVKIRGYRVELGEIEHALQSHKEIEEVVVLTRENQNNENELVAYITSKEEQNTSELRSYLKQTLPEYMLPAYFVQLKELPLTSNGKIDKKALPDPQGLGLTSGIEYVAPRNAIEEKLVKIWQEVLQRENIGVKDDFFALGGHSLKAVRLSNEYWKELAVKLSLKDLFAHTSIELHVKLIQSSKKEEFIQIEKVANQSSYPISDAQRRLWVLSQFEESSVAYNIPGGLALNQEIDIECFKKSIDSTIERHEILRTIFKEDETGEIRQWILNKEELGFKIDYRDYRKERNKNESVQSYMSEDSYNAFDLVKGPLLRSALLQIEDHEYFFYINMHHIIGDGWSMEVLSKDVFSYYEAYKENKQPELKELRIQYKDYSAWQLAQIGESSFKGHRDYWLRSLGGELPLLDLPGSKQRPRLKTYNGRSLGTYLDKSLTRKLKDYSQQHGGSLFMGLLASLNAILYRYTNQKDIIIGSPIAGREHADLEDQIGFYVNTLALRNEINPEESFDDLFSRVKQNTLSAYSHQMYPFDRLVEELDLVRDTSRSAIFDAMLILQNNGEKTEGVQLTEEELEGIVDQGYSASKFDLEIALEETGDYLSLRLVYNPDVYDRAIVEGLINHYRQLLASLLVNPNEKISTINYLSKSEEQELLVTFNDTAVDYPKDKTIVDLFGEQAEKTPDNIAVVFEEKELTYRELNEQSNQLAHYLQKNYEIKADDLVGIKQERSEWMIVSILGVLKAGGAYVPIDPNYPQDRIDYIEKDTKCKVCIDENELRKFKESQTRYSKKKITSCINASNLVYVIYTSGSTGIPKGVLVEYSGVVNRLMWMLRELKINEEDVFLQKTPTTFDVSVWELFLPFITGSKLLVARPESHKDPVYLEKVINKFKISVIHFVPSMLSGALENIAWNKFKNLRHVVCSGEALPKKLEKSFKEKAPLIQLHNYYGPTEASVDVTSINLSQFPTTRDDVSIGKPVDNTKIYVVNEMNKLQAIGVLGEILIGGVQIARGYLNQAELTAEKFISNPFKLGERMYKTGDLGRWLPDGNIEFIGRKDDQVKIRGYRIELGEIEHALQGHAEIEEAVVIAKNNNQGEKELVAFITGKTEQNINDLRNYLKTILPEYMLPSYYVQLEAMPLTSNGKIDKKLLPDPQGLELSRGIEYVAPRNEIEEKLVKIWERLLQRDVIGVKEDFFALGGHSLKAVRLSNEYQKEFSVKTSLRDLFANTSIESHAELIRSSKNEDFIQIEKVVQQESYSISNAQRRLWVLSQFEDAFVAYNMPGSIDLNESIDIESFKRAIDSTIDRHEILRTVFKEDKTGEVRQWILKKEELDFKIDYRDFRKEKNKEENVKAYISKDSYKPFDLVNGSLLRAGLFQIEDESYVFYFNMHHIISDGWSIDVLSKDVFAYYKAYKSNKEPDLKPLKIQYKDYSAWQLGQLEEESFKAHRDYWLDSLKGELPLLDLPAIKQRPKFTTYNGHSLTA
ncbi:MAG: amino acid adenylation domain-containing protein, partial [Parachlamydiaceae bacterium]|nr:amino acid adenylation domain-containing protein [Parachlamydiaceae bacterium]